MRSLYQQCKQAYQNHPYPTLNERLRWLKALETLMVEHQESLAQAVSQDFGRRSTMETQMLEILPSCEGVRYMCRHLAAWMAPKKVSVSLWAQPAAASVLPQPVGVVGIMTSWNYPISLVMDGLAAALSAGNRVLIKPSEHVPKTNALLKDLLPKYLGADVVHMVEGGPDAAQEFASLPFDHLLFTGAADIGKRVMAAASANLTPVTLELGGKSPVLVGPNERLGYLAKRIVFSKIANAGQLCVAPDYTLVQVDRLEALVNRLREKAELLYPTLLENSDATSVISCAHYQRLTSYVQEAQEAGVRIITVNPAHEENLEKKRIFPFTILVNPPTHLKVMNEEIFGPILPVVPYDGFEEALNFIRERPRPLALYLFEHDEKRIQRVQHTTHSGGLSINQILFHAGQSSLPFGGIGASGMGRYHGHAGFETFSHQKAIYEQKTYVKPGQIFLPPYTSRARWLLSRLISKGMKL